MSKRSDLLRPRHRPHPVPGLHQPSSSSADLDGWADTLRTPTLTRGAPLGTSWTTIARGRSTTSPRPSETFFCSRALVLLWCPVYTVTLLCSWCFASRFPNKAHPQSKRCCPPPASRQAGGRNGQVGGGQVEGEGRQSHRVRSLGGGRSGGAGCCVRLAATCFYLPTRGQLLTSHHRNNRCAAPSSTHWRWCLTIPTKFKGHAHCRCAVSA